MMKNPVRAKGATTVSPLNIWGGVTKCQLPSLGNSRHFLLYHHYKEYKRSQASTDTPLLDLHGAEYNALVH